MANIRINDLPPKTTPAASDVVPVDGTTTGKSTLTEIVNAGRPFASQAEAEAGTVTDKGMNPLTTAQAIAALGAGQFASSAQGATADSALQPDAIGTTVQPYGATLAGIEAQALAEGDILYATGPDTLVRLPAGADGQVLRIDAGVPEWTDADGLGDLLAANNLDDLDSTATARDNLGLEIGADVQAYAANLDTLAAVTPGAAGLDVLAGATANNVRDLLGLTEANVKAFEATGDGVTDDRAACQAAIDYVVALGGGDVIFPTGTYLLEPTASPGTDPHDDGLVIPFTGFTVDNRVRLIASGLAVLKAGGDDMVVVRCCQPGSEIIGLEIDGGCTVGAVVSDGLSGVIGIGLVAEDRSQITTLVSQSFCKVLRCHVHNCAEGLVLEPGPTITGSQSGAFYPVVEGNHFNLNIRSMWFKPSSTDATNRPTRGNLAFNRVERGNTGIDLEYATEFTLAGDYFQFFNTATYGTSPRATASAVHIGSLSENNFVIGGANEASDNYFWNEATLPNGLQLLLTPIGGISTGLSFNPFYEAHGFRTTRRTASYEQNAWTAHHSGFGRAVWDWDAANVRDFNVETNGVRRMSWFNGVTVHYGSGGNISLLSNGTTISGTASLSFSVSGVTTNNMSFTSGATGNITVSTVSFGPNANNTVNLGNAVNRWKEVFAVAGTINTSDARFKDWRGRLDDAELNVAKRLSKMIGVYRWKEAVTEKGDGARLHAGVTVQAVIAAFEAEGLDPFAYGMVCYDEWDDILEPVMELREVIITDKDGPIIDEETGEPLSEEREVDTGEKRVVTPAGDMYALRPDELWAFVAAGFEARLAALEA